MGARWTEAEFTRVRRMRDDGMTYDEIGLALGRTGAAVKDMTARRQPVGTQQRSRGSAIGLTREDVRLREDAANGSAMLLAQIERVFGKAA